jgi:hypothetical protein
VLQHDSLFTNGHPACTLHRPAGLICTTMLLLPPDLDMGIRA